MRVEFDAERWAKEVAVDLPPPWEDAAHIPAIGDCVLGPNTSMWYVTKRFWLPYGNGVIVRVSP